MSDHGNAVPEAAAAPGAAGEGHTTGEAGRVCPICQVNHGVEADKEADRSKAIYDALVATIEGVRQPDDTSKMWVATGIAFLRSLLVLHSDTLQGFQANVARAMSSMLDFEPDGPHDHSFKVRRRKHGLLFTDEEWAVEGPKVDAARDQAIADLANVFRDSLTSFVKERFGTDSKVEVLTMDDIMKAGKASTEPA